MSGTLLPLLDTIVATVPVPTGVARDTSASEPSPYLPDTLYGWPLPELRRREGLETDRSDFGVRLALTRASAEGPGLPRDRVNSVALDDAAAAIADWVTANPVGPSVDGHHLWGQLRVERVVRDAIRGEGYRGLWIDLAGWRFIEL